MAQERKQQAARAAVKRFFQGSESPETLVDLFDQQLPSVCSMEELLEQASQWFLTLRVFSKQAAPPHELPIARFFAALGKVARKREVDPELFYSALLERFLLESSAEETARGWSKESTKARVLEAALDVFSEKGFHLATVDEIAEHAGVGKGTLYRYFANKESLFSELVRMRTEELERSANAVLDEQDDVLTMITKVLRVYFEFFDRNQRLYRLIVQERMDVGDQFKDLYIRKVIRRTPVLKLKIFEASQQGVLKDVDFQSVFYGVMGFIHGVIQRWIACDCAYPLVDELPTVMEVLFYGFVRSSKMGGT